MAALLEEDSLGRGLLFIPYLDRGRHVCPPRLQTMRYGARDLLQCGQRGARRPISFVSPVSEKFTG